MITDLMFGGLTGLIGGIAEKITAYKTKKLELELQKEKFANEIALRKVDAEIMQQEWAARTKVAEVEGAAKVEVEDAKAFATSYRMEPKTYGIKWLDALRGSIRPALTLYLCAVVTTMYLRTDGGTIDAQSVANTILYLCVTAVCWWFGSRGVKAPK